MEENYFPRGSSHPPATTSDKESLKKTKKRKPDGAEKPEKESPSYLFGVNRRVLYLLSKFGYIIFL